MGGKGRGKEKKRKKGGRKGREKGREGEGCVMAFGGMDAPVIISAKTAKRHGKTKQPCCTCFYAHKSWR